MAVFTSITSNELDNLLESFDLSPHNSFQGIATGTVNSNYLVQCQEGTFVLTILEATSHEKANELFAYAQHCKQNNIPCPKLFKSKQKNLSFNGKPVALAEFIPGQSSIAPSNSQCFQLGQILGQLHRVGQDFPIHMTNTMGNDWREQTYLRLKETLSEEDSKTFEELIALQKDLESLPLPKGIIHFDLFRDNALYHQGSLSGIIDFYYACYDVLALDLAISLNDWCAQWHLPQPSLDLQKVAAMLDGYLSQRQPQRIEVERLFELCKVACGHFWLARLDTLKQAKSGEGDFEKDPLEFKRLLEALNNQESQLKATLDCSLTT